jgi:tRNA threonylcarbamoyladenosine biosynthesis protein TsaE
MTTVTTRSLEEFQQEAVRVARELLPHATHARVFAFSGELGAGKTTYTQNFARALGVIEPVTSPTFIIYKVYDLPEQVLFERLVHVDAYRLEHKDELITHGFMTLLEDPLNIVILEWPEKVAGLLDTIPHTHVTFSVEGQEMRIITYEEKGE